MTLPGRLPLRRLTNAHRPRDALIAGMRAGIFRHGDVWELAMIISATLHGLVQLHAGGRIGLPDHEFRTLCRTAVEGVLDGIRT